MSNLKAFADDSLDVGYMMEFVINWFEKIKLKLENAGYHHFLLFHMFSKLIFSGSLKIEIVW